MEVVGSYADDIGSGIGGAGKISQHDLSDVRAAADDPRTFSMVMPSAMVGAVDVLTTIQLALAGHFIDQ